MERIDCACREYLENKIDSLLYVGNESLRKFNQPTYVFENQI